jgi:glucose-6-phosphate isomerase
MEQLGPLLGAVEATVAGLVDRKVLERIWARDHTVWQEDPTGVADRLGWLEVAPEILADRERLDTFATTASTDGITHVVVMGMGGSSLFP